MQHHHLPSSGRKSFYHLTLDLIFRCDSISRHQLLSVSYPVNCFTFFCGLLYANSKKSHFSFQCDDTHEKACVKLILCKIFLMHVNDETLPEAQWIRAIRSGTWVISAAKFLAGLQLMKHSLRHTTDPGYWACNSNYFSDFIHIRFSTQKLA